MYIFIFAVANYKRYDLGVESLKFSVCGNFDKLFFVSSVLLVREFIPATTKFATFTDDLEMQGHVILLVTLPI